MGNYENLKQSITEVIRTNGNKEITGAVLQSTLLTIISTVGANATFAGIATPTTNPGTPDGSVFYLASESGTYSNFGGAELQDGLSVLTWNGSWSSQQIFGVDNEPTAGSTNPVSSGGVQEELALGAVYDVSSKNPTAGVNNDGKFESLSALLGDANLNTLIPTSVRKGGMSIKFVQSSDNKYVRYNYLLSSTANADFANVANWQGVDKELKAGSGNLLLNKDIYNALGFSGLVMCETLEYETWSNNATIATVDTNVMGKADTVTKVDFHINNTSANTLGFSYRPTYKTFNEGDIINFAVCIYTEDEVERNYELGLYVVYWDGTWTRLLPKNINIRKGFNYFFCSFRSTFTQVVTTASPLIQLFFHDNTLDGKTWYIKGYVYKGTPNQKFFPTIDAAPTLNSENLILSGGVKAALDSLQTLLNGNILNTVKSGYLYAGIATPATNPGTPNVNVFYITSQDGTYTNFKDSNNESIVVDSKIAVLKYNGTNWILDTAITFDDEPKAGSKNPVKSSGVYNIQNFFGLIDRHDLTYETWGNAVVTTVTSNIMGIKEDVRKIDFHINDSTMSTFAFRFTNKLQSMNVLAGDILNFAICIYVEEDIDKTLTLGRYFSGFADNLIPLTPLVLHIKKGFNYFWHSAKVKTTQTLPKNSVYEVLFHDDTLDGTSWYYKAYCYWGAPYQKLLIPFDSTLVEDSKNLVRGGDIKKYVDVADDVLNNYIFYNFNFGTLQISSSGNHGYTLAKYDKYYSVTYNHVDESGYSVGNILIGYARDFRNGERKYLRYDVKVFAEGWIIKAIPSQWGETAIIGNGVPSIKSIEGGYYIDYSQSVLDAIDNLSDDTPIVFAFGINDGNSGQYNTYNGKTGIFKASNYVPDKFNYEDDKVLRVDYVENNVKAVEQRVEELEEQVGLGTNVVCWGDSLTAGAGHEDTTNAATVKAAIEAKGYTLSASTYNYVAMLQALLGSNYNVVNCGVGGENINAISARQGGNLAVFSDIVELPADTSIVNVSRPISSFDRSSRVNVLLQGDRNVNPCYVQGIPCTLSVTYSEGYTNIQYKLKRNDAGNRAVTLPQYTPIVMKGSKLNPSTEIAVLWCWQNGGYSTNDELVEKLKNMINHLNTTKYILIGLHSMNLSDGNVQEALLEKTFGDKFFNWRQYASTNALYDFGITPTTEDITAMGTGSMPPSLLHDAVHLNSAGYMILGWKLYERMKNIGYID